MIETAIYWIGVVVLVVIGLAVIAWCAMWGLYWFVRLADWIKRT